MWRVGIRRTEMPLAEERFRSHLAEDESVRELTSGRLLADAVRGPAAIGLTDRRLLCVSPSGEFVAVRYDYVSSIRGQRRTSVEYVPAGERNRLLSLLGGLAAVLGLAAVVLVASGADPIRGAATVTLAVATVAVTAAVGRLRKRTAVGGTAEQVALGAGVLALLSLVGLGLFAATAVAPLFAVSTLGGLGLAGYAARHWETLRELELDRTRETHLTVEMIGGDSVRIAVDAESNLGRRLGICVHRDPTPADLPPADHPRPDTGSAAGWE